MILSISGGVGPPLDPFPLPPGGDPQATTTSLLKIIRHTLSI